MSQSRTRNQKGAEASSEPATKSGNPTIHQTRHTPAKTQTVSQQRIITGTAAQNPASGQNYKEHANRAVTDNVSLSTTTPFTLNNPDKGNDIISAIQKDLSTQLGNISLAHTEFTKDGRFSSKAGGLEDQGDCCPSSKGCVQTLLSADCKTGECFDVQQHNFSLCPS